MVIGSRKAFTLAEVLVTLGIIGIVAALTMPSLIANYNKKVLGVRIKKFYSVLTQAVRMKEAEDGDIDVSMINANNSPDVAMEFFNVNYKPYMRVIVSEKMSKGFSAGFSDGSGMYIRRTGTCNNVFYTTACTYIYFCTYYKYCKDIDESGDTAIYGDDILHVDGKNTFLFWVRGEYEGVTLDETREQIKSKCKNNKYYCTKLIATDGWEIKDDYPW
ncbi:MAG: type II secretion system GspH family protein [Heliobacteriaceae bacterium]|jgi:prepilin-type N-terminal cleavage/methylation domain-containing protein|nr:type II secretion system GspH family protein [Heliobacteriaceae bacterium]